MYSRLIGDQCVLSIFVVEISREQNCQVLVCWRLLAFTQELRVLSIGLETERLRELGLRDVTHRDTMFMTPSSSHGGAAPLMGAAGVRSLFFPAIEEESQQAEEEPALEPPTLAFAQLAVSGICSPRPGLPQCLHVAHVPPETT